MKVLFLGGNVVMTGYEAEAIQSITLETSKSSNIAEYANKRLTSISVQSDGPKALASWLEEQGEHVVYTEEKVTTHDVRVLCPDLIVSYNYKFILPKEVIDEVRGNAINLHISFLPYNRGYHAYVWSFLENTPKGVTIHYMSEGIDSGDILVQKEIFIDEEKETLKSSFEILHREIQLLFKENWKSIENSVLITHPQTHGSIHFKSELAKFAPFIQEKGWDTPIRELKENYYR